MKPIYLFDVDGTLTPPRMPIDKGFSGFFHQFTKANNVYLVSGSDYGKIEEQLPETILDNCKGIFGCSGAQYVEKGREVYRKEHRFPRLLNLICETFVDTSPYTRRFGNHIELRPGMLNVSVVGRNATNAARWEYFQWDQMVNERQDFVNLINKSTLPYEASSGGEISIDIVPNGWNKSVVMTEVLTKNPDANLVFFGDRICPGGNDLPLAEALTKADGNHMSIAVENYAQTWRHLETNQLTNELIAA